MRGKCSIDIPVELAITKFCSQIIMAHPDQLSLLEQVGTIWGLYFSGMANVISKIRESGLERSLCGWDHVSLLQRTEVGPQHNHFNSISWDLTASSGLLWASAFMYAHVQIHTHFIFFLNGQSQKQSPCTWQEHQYRYFSWLQSLHSDHNLVHRVLNCLTIL